MRRRRKYRRLDAAATLRLLITLAVIACSTPSDAAPDEYLPDLAKDLVYWRTKILLCQRAGKTAEADAARERMRRAESYLFGSTYTESEAVAAIREAEAHYTNNPIRGGC